MLVSGIRGLANRKIQQKKKENELINYFIRALTKIIAANNDTGTSAPYASVYRIRSVRSFLSFTSTYYYYCPTHSIYMHK